MRALNVHRTFAVSDMKEYHMMEVDACVVGKGEAEERMADFFAPAQVDQTVRHALQYCWMALPKDRRTPEEMEPPISAHCRTSH